MPFYQTALQHPQSTHTIIIASINSICIRETDALKNSDLGVFKSGEKFINLDSELRAWHLSILVKLAKRCVICFLCVKKIMSRHDVVMACRLFCVSAVF